MHGVRTRARVGQRERGSMLTLTMVFVAVVMAGVTTMLSLSHVNTRDVRFENNRLQARVAAESALQAGISFLKETRDKSSVAYPFTGFDSLDPNNSTGETGYSRLLMDQQLTDATGRVVAEYDVVIDSVSGDSTSRQLNLSAFAYVPSKASYRTNAPASIRREAHASIELSFAMSEVFNYSYFINHWGWFYGNSIYANGNVRSNGQFDFGGYSATVNGSPRYESTAGTDLIGYIDDNEDGVTDGSDGGVFAGLSVVNSSNVNGMGGLAQNQHSASEQVSMPNLSDLTFYESQAQTLGASVTVGPTTYVNGVLGDDSGEKEHLYLEGTAADPIVLNGPVVVRGSVIIKGYVTGQGSIYSGGNVYIADDLQYVNPPASNRPATNDEAATEAWLEANKNRDSLGLFAREHVVVGNYEDGNWQYYVNNWLSSSLNKSAEDAGIDGIQNSANGLDGIAGTADDDLLEDDGEWTVSTYSDADDALGLIPPGKTVGDVIPGSGEDIDGDGLQDGPTQMSEFNIPASLSSTNWEGNVSWSGTRTFTQVSTNYVAKIEACMYTNHTFGALMFNWGGDIEINGSIISRNESIIYGANAIRMNHDPRLLSGGGDNYGFYAPKNWESIEVTSWEMEREFSVSEHHLADPDQLILYVTGEWTPGPVTP